MRLTWDKPGEKFYELGCDRGVLYPPSGVGVAWSGLISIDESPQSSETRSYYLDGVMYLQVPGAEEFQATINAVHRPAEFSECDGIAPGLNGLMVMQQRRRPFGLCYRTLVGNDLKGAAYSYRIHLVYNALTIPSARSYSSMGSSVNVARYSWQISALPPEVPGYRNSAHLIIDSATAPADLLTQLEDILYGTAEIAPRLPTPQEIFDLGFGFTVIDFGDGTFSVTGPDEFVFLSDPDTYSITSPTIEFLDADSYTISSG
jgi:hypothetical protein